MIFENLHDFEFFIEDYSKIKIPISSTVNSSGIIQLDENNNSMYSTLISNSPVTSIVGYSVNYGDYLLLYNDNKWGMFKDYLFTKDKELFSINSHQPTKYKIRARKHSVVNQTNNTNFSIDLTNRDIFKVFLNNKEIKSYTNNITYITITDSTLLDDFYNSLTVISYTTNQAITSNFYLTYEGVVAPVPVTGGGTCDYTAFNTMTRVEVFNEFSDTITPTQDIIYCSDDDFVGEAFTNSYSNKLSTTINDNLLKKFDVANKFRLICYNMVADTLYVYTNCRVLDGINKSFNADVNKKTISITFQDRISVYGTDNRYYNEGIYNEGVYGGAVVISAIYKDKI